jgi:phosphoenolpyruvate carboxykinase (ATP)
MKDSVLPPVIKITDRYLAIALGAALMTQRNRAENVAEEELKKLVFEPFANPFRVYELHKDVDAFLNVMDSGAEIYAFNSKGYWKESDEVLEKIPLQTSLTIQTAILTDQLEWEEWKTVPGTLIPTKESIDRLVTGYYDRYNPATRQNLEDYYEMLADRFKQRIDFLKESDVKDKPETLANLLNSLKVVF